MKSDKKLRGPQLVYAYERASGNHVRDGYIYDSGGHQVCRYTAAMARNYLKEVKSPCR